MSWLKTVLPISQTGRLITQDDSEYSQEWIIELYLHLFFFFIQTLYSPPNKHPFCFDLLIQFEYVSQHLVFANCIPLILKFFNQNILSYITAKNR